MINRIKLLIQYKGTRYSGWQRQKNAVTVQEVLEDALCKACGHPVTLEGSGRTDEGVHAEAQAAHFDTGCGIPPDKYPLAVNGLLPQDIKILHSAAVSADFHARFCAIGKTYRYRMYFGNVPLPLLDELSYFSPHRPDVHLMAEAARYFVGRQDFAAFMSTGRPVKSTVREVFEAEVTGGEGEAAFTVSGGGFLYNMVRIMAGTLLDVGRGKIPPDAVREIIQSRDRAKAGMTLPPRGLCLLSVKYPENPQPPVSQI